MGRHLQGGGEGDFSTFWRKHFGISIHLQKELIKSFDRFLLGFSYTWMVSKVRAD